MDSEFSARIPIPCLDPPVHAGRHLLRQGQPDTRPDGLTRQFVFGAVKKFKYFFQLVFGDAGTVIAYFELNTDVA